jgi:hypothetical protein
VVTVLSKGNAKADLAKVSGIICVDDATWEKWLEVSKKWLDGELSNSAGTTLHRNYTLINRKPLTKTNLKPVNSLPPFAVKEAAEMILAKKVSIMVPKAGSVSLYVCMEFIFYIGSAPYLI